MKIITKNNSIILHEPNDFNLSHIFDCGQCFRFNVLDDGSYIGTAYDKTIRISEENGDIILHNTSRADFDNVWYDFLDLDRNYTSIKLALTETDDPIMEKAIKYGSGIRILQQELWETLISFIISASNNIPRIKKIIELLCSNFGTAHEYMGNVYYSFPTAEKIASLSLDELSVIRSGFRDKYILNCARAVVCGDIDLDAIKRMSIVDAKKTLMSIYGVGNKVSDCVLLFGLHRLDSFPIDVWIKRIMEFCYFDDQKQSIRTISDFASNKFGSLGGIAQQYLFFYARECKIGTGKEK